MDPEVEALSLARDSSSVLKTKLMDFRDRHPDAVIFAFEGPDDCAAYYQWTRAINHRIKYEPFICKNKSQVLKLYRSSSMDKSGLDSDVYFFVDRDFDDLNALDGHPAGPNLFMTERYAIENYVVSEETVDEILKTEFHCGAQPSVRATILGSFTTAYESFLAETKELNFRLYQAIKMGIDVKKKPEKIKDLAVVGLSQCGEGGGVPSALIVLAREPNVSEADVHREAFEALSPPERYRGKWSFSFLLNWLDELAKDRRSTESLFFASADRSLTVNTSVITLQLCASKSSPPPNLRPFLETHF